MGGVRTFVDNIARRIDGARRCNSPDHHTVAFLVVLLLERPLGRPILRKYTEFST